jgi:hypothetical protein
MSEADENQIARQPKDLYHHGVITKLFPSNNTGIVRTESGREVPFPYDLVILCGEAKSVQDLKEGQRVGYDVGWTSNGLRITKLKTYPQVSDEAVQALERHEGQGENLPAQDLSNKNSQ